MHVWFMVMATEQAFSSCGTRPGPCSRPTGCAARMSLVTDETAASSSAAPSGCLSWRNRALYPPHTPTCISPRVHGRSSPRSFHLVSIQGTRRAQAQS
uniref:Uncharacterized protein n=1 Tax=Arundo donax TaxID=35708 RepID=A0A0A9DPD2_ARUDO